MRGVIFALIVLLCYLQYALWFGKGGLRDVRQMREVVTEQETEIARLKERNQTLAAEVADLKQGLEAIEERARSEIGMIKKDETFYQILPPSSETAAPNESNSSTP